MICRGRTFPAKLEVMIVSISTILLILSVNFGNNSSHFLVVQGHIIFCDVCCVDDVDRADDVIGVADVVDVVASIVQESMRNAYVYTLMCMLNSQTVKVYT